MPELSDATGEVAQNVLGRGAGAALRLLARQLAVDRRLVEVEEGQLLLPTYILN